ncbi:MAG: 23S rRNA (pseudouridine(1915)-N(3))-methyltransferase RlmH [Parasporobacterium sp.]|nr:23S rRNA (pseudouridine(1915)-N(3))-methyltransferase RlmH [Parasporobacterium sp.]
MIKLICVGKLKEDYLKAAVNEYSKRLSSYCRLQIIQVDDEKCSENASVKEEEAVRDKEALKIIKNIKDTDYVITLEIKGKQYTSEGFAALIEKLPLTGHSDITFVIGGSIGLGDAVLKRSDMALSFSEMTFPHQLMRVILLEQLYRSYKINKNEPYHK